MTTKKLLDIMNDESEELETIFTLYTLSKKENNDIVYCFFEGEDYKYYCSRIRTFLDKDKKIKIFDCHGKSNVLTIYGMIKDKTKDVGTKNLFFIDKDFDRFITQNDEIYTTPYYAIENFYITDEAIEDFFMGELKISESCNEKDKKDFISGITFYKNEREKFINKIILLNVWYSTQQNKGKLNANTSFPNLEKLKTLKNIKFPITIKFLEDNTPNYIEVSMLEIEGEKTRLLKDPIKNFRGKYFIEFLYDVLITLTSCKAKNQKIFSKTRKVSFTIGKSNIISLLSQYAETPQCLTKYLQSKLSYKYEDTLNNIG
jgi:hypothetical protein